VGYGFASGSSHGSSWKYNPTRASARVVLAELFDTSNAMEAMFNPEQLELSVEAGVGDLQPVGWSHGIQQYGHTKCVSFPLTFIYTLHGLRFRDPPLVSKKAFPFMSLTDAVGWFSSFVYPRDYGVAPSPMLVVWPRVLTMAVVVRSVSAKYTRFDRDLEPREVQITTQLSEIRQQLKISSQQRFSAWVTSWEGHTLHGGAGAGFRPGTTGAPLAPGISSKKR